MDKLIDLKSLVSVWKTAIEAAKRDKEPFQKTADICKQFFCNSIDGMWSNSYRQKYLGGMPRPSFAITIAKTSELTSIVGPTLMWNVPGRYVSGYEPLNVSPEEMAISFGAEPGTPDFDFIVQNIAQESGRDLASQNTRNALMQHYLNYSQREQPGGGLKVDSQMAIIDALVKGRGCVRVDTYQPSGPGSTLTGSFFMSVDDLFIDPECTRPNLSNANWIAVRHCEPHWKVEQRFGWPPGSLRNKTISKSKTKANENRVANTIFTKNSQTNDLCVWFEVFSKCGVGTRFKQSAASQWHDAFEKYVGDYAYICFMPNEPQLLNAPDRFLENADVDQVATALSWPIPYHKDSRWPVAMLDFWLNPDSAWPIATVGMGIGELTFMNLIVSALADRTYRSSLTKTALRAELADDCVAKLLSLQHEVMELNPTIAGSVSDMVSFMQQPPVPYDAFRMLDYVSSMFDKRVGLTELMYGLNPGGKVSRTAQDARIKGEAVNVRPEHMAAQVEAWQTEIANLERIAAGYSVSGKTLVPLFGSSGAALWDQLITQADPDVYMRQMRSRIEANSLRKPNKARDNENITQMTGYMLPMLQWYAQSSGNTDPLNAYIKTIGRAIDQDVSEWAMPSLNQQQGPSPEEIERMQQLQELEAAEKQEKLQSRKLQNAKTAHQMLEQGQGMPADMLLETTLDDESQYSIPL